MMLSGFNTGVPVRAAMYRMACLYSVSDLAAACGVSPGFVLSMFARGVIEPLVEDSHGRMWFGVRELERLQRACRLRMDLGVNVAGLGVVLDLLDRIEELENTVASLNARMGGYA